MAQQTTISPQATKEILLFIENSRPRRLSRNLRSLLLFMLLTRKDGYPFNMDDLLTDLVYLFELLDVLEDEK